MNAFFRRLGPSRPAPEDRMGFTLIEVLLACAIAAMLLIGLYGAFRASIDAVGGVEEVSGRRESDRIVGEILENDLLSLKPPEKADGKDEKAAYLIAPSEESRKPNDDGDITILSLLTGAGGYFDDSESPGRIYRVAWLLRPYPGEEDRFLLVRRELPHPWVVRRDEENPTPTRDMVLAENVASFTFQFETGKDEPEESFDGAASAANKRSPFPLSVRYVIARTSDKGGKDKEGERETSGTICLIPESVTLR